MRLWLKKPPFREFKEILARVSRCVCVYVCVCVCVYIYI